MKKKAVSILLTVAMAAMTLAGCGSSSDGSASTGDSSAASTTESSSESEEVAAATDLEPVTLHFIFFGDKKSATDEVWDAIADYTRDTLNCDYDVQFIPGDDYKQKLLVKAATGDAWDLNFDADWVAYYQMTANDAYMNLDELLPQYAPDLYKVYEEKDLLGAASSKGHVTCLPWTMTMNNRPFFQWRGDLAEKAGITVDKDNFNTIEDVDKLLYQLKEAYPDKYILEGGNVLVGGDWFPLDSGNGLYFKLSDPKCTVTLAEDIPEYIEMAKYTKKWQDDGIIWKDVLTDKRDHNDLINEGMLITKWGTHEFANQNRAWAEEGAYWDFTEIYKDSLYANRSPLSNAVCIPATSENPERTLMFLNMLETDETLYDMVHYGIEGKTYVLNAEGGADYPEGMDGASSNFMEWGGRWGLWKPQFMKPDASYGPGFWTAEAEYAASSDKNVVSPLEGFSFDSSEVTTEIAQRNQIFNDMHKLINVGLGGDPEAAIAKCKEDCIAAGTDKLLEEYQKQIDAFLAAK